MAGSLPVHNVLPLQHVLAVLPVASLQSASIELLHGAFPAPPVQPADVTITVEQNQWSLLTLTSRCL